MKKYGIYLAYPPTVDMRAEGLGRHLAEFLKGAQARGDVRFVISCPSWMKENLLELFNAAGVRHNSFEIIAPTNLPVLLRLYFSYSSFKKRNRKNISTSFFNWPSKLGNNLAAYAENKLVSSRSLLLASILGFMLLPIILFVLLISYFKNAVTGIIAALYKFLRRTLRHNFISKSLAMISRLVAQPKQDSLVMRMYRLMEQSEVLLMRELINARIDIAAWYCPTAFWPHFNNITAPRLMCVPDVVLTNFPVGFASIGGQRFHDNFRQVEKAIEGAEHFVTYSEDVKWRTLVERYHVDSDVIKVVTHGANRLDELIKVIGFADNEASTDLLCRNLFKMALCKAVNNGFAFNFGSGDVKFIFYASQFRPNKNVITLLKAYEYLLKRRYVSHKLVLTGNPNSLPEIAQFIVEHNLVNDVLCLHGLTAQELAACYRLADLAINPSLSEGGCPFTFTEALSVGTPVVMAKIPVTTEVLNDPSLDQAMFFDPYNWKDMATRIEWAIQNHDELLNIQRPIYEKLAQRTWGNVVEDYIKVLDKISLTADRIGESK